MRGNGVAACVRVQGGAERVQVKVGGGDVLGWCVELNACVRTGELHACVFRVELNACV